MYNNPVVPPGLGAGAAGAGALATTGFEALWISVAVISMIVGGFVLLRSSRLRRAAEVTPDR